MAESKQDKLNHRTKRAVIVGIPGVGKTTVIARAAELMGKGDYKATVVVFGTLMFEEAKRSLGLNDRDEMRGLPIETQRKLQEMAARRIAEMQQEIVIIDTHLFISTREGYYPGLPMRLLDIMKPTNMVMVSASADEIAKRRKADRTRSRDSASTEDIQRELDISRVMVASCSILTGAPFAIVMNSDGAVEQTAEKIIKILGGKES